MLFAKQVDIRTIMNILDGASRRTFGWMRERNLALGDNEHISGEGEGLRLDANGQLLIRSLQGRQPRHPLGLRACGLLEPPEERYWSYRHYIFVHIVKHLG